MLTIISVVAWISGWCCASWYWTKKIKNKTLPRGRKRSGNIFNTDWEELDKAFISPSERANAHTHAYDHLICPTPKKLSCRYK